MNESRLTGYTFVRRKRKNPRKIDVNTGATAICVGVHCEWCMPSEMDAVRVKYTKYLSYWIGSVCVCVCDLLRTTESIRQTISPITVNKPTKNWQRSVLTIWPEVGHRFVWVRCVLPRPHRHQPSTGSGWCQWPYWIHRMVPSRPPPLVRCSMASSGSWIARRWNWGI